MNKYLLCLMLYYSGVAGQSNPSTPHGGNIRASGDYFVEMVACSEYFEIYVYDPSLNPLLNSNIKGYVVYLLKNNVRIREELNVWGIDGFSVKGCEDGFIQCSVNIVHHGRPVSVVFENNFTCVEK